MAIQSQPSRISEPFAGSGTKNTIPATNATPSASQAASWASGFPPECSQPISAGGCPVPRNDVNGVLNWLSQGFAFHQDGGVWEWSALADYDAERMVRGSDGLLYWSVAQSGPGFASGAVDPIADDGTYWHAPYAKTMGALENSGAVATTKWVWSAFGAEAFYVDAVNGSDSNDGRSQTTSLKTIGQAIALAKSYNSALAKICVETGTYAEDVQINNMHVAVELQGNITVSGIVEVYNGASLVITDNGGGHTIAVSSTTGISVSVIEQSLLYSKIPLNITTASGSLHSVFVSDSSVLWTGSSAPIDITANGTTGNAFEVYTGSSAMLGANVHIGGTGASGGVEASYSSSIYFYAGLVVDDMLTWGAGVAARFASCISFYQCNATIRASAQSYHYAILSAQSSFVEFKQSASVQVYTKATGQSAVCAYDASGINFESCTVSMSLGSGSMSGFLVQSDGCINVWAGSFGVSGSVGTAFAVAEECGVIRFLGGASATGSLSGAKYQVQRGGQINVGGAGPNIFPGSGGNADASSFGYYG